MMMEGRYNNDDLLVRLRAVFGRVDQVRHHIDVALQQDDTHRRKRNMRFLVLPTRFPRPESMSQGDTTVWTNWIREETDKIMKQLEEERDSRSDPDDPFNGTANGVFQPLQDPLSLPPPVQTPKRQGNNILKTRGKMSENIIQRVEKREETRRSLLRKVNRVSFENILEIRWTRWKVFAICTGNRGKTNVARKNKTKTIHLLIKHREYTHIRTMQT